MPAILFVCTANICRSPMAEGLLKGLISRRADAKEWVIASAGLMAIPGQSASENAIEALHARRLDIQSHHARLVTQDLIENYDLILTMEKWQKERLITRFPQVSERILMLSEIVGSMEDIEDPYGSELADYETTAGEIHKLLLAGMKQIIKLAKANHLAKGM